MEINREIFEAWLFNQPRERLFNYTDGGAESKPGCLLCNFFRETSKPMTVGESSYWREYLVGAIPSDIREFLHDCIKSEGLIDFIFSAGKAQDLYIKRFGNPTQITEVKEVQTKGKELVYANQ